MLLMGKTHYFYGHFQVRKLLTSPGRVTTRALWSLGTFPRVKHGLAVIESSWLVNSWPK